MIARSGWDIDLRDGVIHEKWLESVLRGKRVELKKDEKSLFTDYFYLEYSNGDDKPTGIAVTEAEFWAFSPSTKMVFIYDIEYVRKMGRYFYARGFKTSGGDGDGTRGILIPQTALFPNGARDWDDFDLSAINKADMKFPF